MTERELRMLVVNTAKKYLGCNEYDGSHKKIIDTYNAHTPLARGYKVTYTDAWCATFVSAVAIECGLTDIMPTECSCTRMIELHKAIGQWKEEDNYKPEIGDVVMYDWEDSGKGENKGQPNHVGIVCSDIVDGVFNVIEGNYANAVKVRQMQVNGRYIRGYCLPKYESKATAAPTQSAAKKSITEIAKEVIEGDWGNGDSRKLKLYAAGYDPKAVQDEVNRILSKKKTVAEVAREVIDGKWGNGEERKQKLRAAGYDPKEVQNEVNRLLA